MAKNTGQEWRKLLSKIDPDEVYDDKRQQSPIKDAGKLQAIKQLLTVTNLWDKDWICELVFILKSMKGCAEQYVHQDYTDERLKTYPGNGIPAGFIISIMKGTKFIIYEGCTIKLEESK